MKYSELRNMEVASDLGPLCVASPYIFVYKTEYGYDTKVVGITIGADIKHAAAYRFDAPSVRQLITELGELYDSMVQPEGDLKVYHSVVLSEAGVARWCVDAVKDDYNPRNTLGTVIRTNYSSVLGIEVQWSNGTINEYEPSHLTKIKM